MGFPWHAEFEDQCPIRWLLDLLNPTALKERGDFGQDLFNIGCVECHRGYVGSSLMGMPFNFQLAGNRSTDCPYGESRGPAISVPWGYFGHVFSCATAVPNVRTLRFGVKTRKRAGIPCGIELAFL